MNKNYRHYAISCDWLQLYLHKASDFSPTEPNLFGYNFLPLGYGSKVFKSLYKVIEPSGEELGILSADPYLPTMNQRTCIFKVENNVLYQSDYIARCFQFIACCGLQYKGITRIDLAYDCNELYGGLKHETLIKKYQKNEYLKIGLNRYMAWMNGTYKLVAHKRDTGERDAQNRPIKTETIECITESGGNIQSHRCESITWGSRSSDIQVQVYNKSQELREVKMKHYITEYWKECGLDLDRDVWRIEIRIVNGGKSMKNLKTGETFNLSMDELITQETIEQLFHDYAKKYFRFFYRGTQKKVQQMKEVPVFCLANKTILRPKRLTKSKDYTRMHKITINWMDKNIYENAKLDNVIVREMTSVREYYIKAYGMEKWYKEKQEQLDYNQELTSNSAEIPAETIQDKYKRTFSGLSDEVAERAAKMRYQIEKELEKIKEADINDCDDYDFYGISQYFRRSNTRGIVHETPPDDE